MNKPYEFALIVAGMYEDYQNRIIKGILDYSKQHNINISCFTSFSDADLNSTFNLGENSIYSIINYDKFDGIILMINTIENSNIKNKILADVKKSNLPTVTFDYESSDMYNITIDNNKSMTDLISHVIQYHKAKSIYFISGPDSNPESNIRLNAVKNICDNHNIELEIFHGAFRPSDGKQAIKHLLINNKKLPDAIIAANDAMAIAAIEELKQHGYTVPNDIIVTGFDNTFTAMHYSPALTTVERPLYRVGKKACSILVHALEDNLINKQYNMYSKTIISESCGCSSNYNEDIISFKKTMFNQVDYTKYSMITISNLMSKMSEAETIGNCIEIISDFAKNLDCGKFCLCLYSNFQNMMINSQISTVGDLIISPLTIVNKERLDNKMISIIDMDPHPFTTGGNFSVYYPLHYRNILFGYIIIANSELPLISYAGHILSMSIGNSIEIINKLINLNSAFREINNLYMMDRLCGIYNRNGLISESKEIISNCINNNTKFLISFIDMDDLKTINDQYGHNEGDYAIKSIAVALKKSCSNTNMICARFGGDEFIVIGNNIEIEEFESKFFKQLKQINETNNKPYTIEASIGTILTNITKESDLFKLISEADSIMYEQKKRKKKSKYIRKN